MTAHGREVPSFIDGSVPPDLGRFPTPRSLTAPGTVGSVFASC